MAHIRALAGKAGVNLGLGDTVHDYGIDGTLRHVQIIGNERYESGVNIDIQLKATTDWEADATHVIYDLTAKAYNKLVNRHRRANRVLLVLLCLPKDESLWLSSTEEALILRNCCYWEHVTGKPTKNSASQRIKISRGKVLTAEALKKIVESEYLATVGDADD